MNKPFYEYRDGDAESFARSLFMKTKRKGNELFFEKCPYCGSPSKDDRYKFSINTKTGQFQCKRASCGSQGNMVTLSKDFSFSLGKEVDAYYKSVDFSSKQYRRFKDAHRIFPSTDTAIKYLLDRGIPEEITKKYEITSHKDDDAVICFPFKDKSGELTFIKYRNTKFVKGVTDGHKEWTTSDCKPILFGMNHCDPDEDNGVIVVTEGQIDMLSVAAAGYKNVVSVPMGCNNSTWRPHCYEFLNKFKRIVVFGDCENGRVTLEDMFASRWKTKVYVVRQQDYKGCKDANDILQKYGTADVKNCVQNAEPPFVNCIKPMVLIEDVDIMKIKAQSTGMPNVDSVLDGGFRRGQLAVLSGKRGEGKSTLASMWAVKAISNDMRVFAYSGELPDYVFKNWMNCQVTGKKELTESDKDKLQKWYGDRAYIYDERMVESTEQEKIKLVEAIEIAVIQYNCEFIMIDNMMTAMTDNMDVDLFRQQSQFVEKLVNIAKLHDVFILLIAHPRKSISGQEGEIQNDDISGSSHITDKADLVMSLIKPKKEEPNLRALSITKNRLTGKVAEGKRKIQIVYDPKSRRMAEKTADFFSMNFGIQNELDFYEAAISEDEVPFVQGSFV